MALRSGAGGRPRPRRLGRRNRLLGRQISPQDAQHLLPELPPPHGRGTDKQRAPAWHALLLVLLLPPRPLHVVPLQVIKAHFLVRARAPKARGCWCFTRCLLFLIRVLLIIRLYRPVYRGVHRKSDFLKPGPGVFVFICLLSFGKMELGQNPTSNGPYDHFLLTFILHFRLSSRRKLFEIRMLFLFAFFCVVLFLLTYCLFISSGLMPQLLWLLGFASFNC